MYDIDFDVIKESIAIEDVAELLGIKVRGKRFQCPNQTARYSAAGMKTGYSGSLSKSSNSWYCFCGDCSRGGSTIDMVCHYKGVGVYDAAIFLGETFHVGIKEKDESQKPKETDTFIKRDVLDLIGLKQDPFKPVVFLHNEKLWKSKIMEYIADDMDVDLEIEQWKAMYRNMPDMTLGRFDAAILVWERSVLWLWQAEQCMRLWCDEERREELSLPDFYDYAIRNLQSDIDKVAEVKERMDAVLEEEMVKDTSLRTVFAERITHPAVIKDTFLSKTEIEKDCDENFEETLFQ